MDNDSELGQSGQSLPHKQWSDEICRDISNRDYFPKYILDLDVQKNVIERFLDFYLGGKVPKGFKATDLVFSVISIMPPHMNTEDTMWSEEEYKEEGTLFSLPQIDKNKPSVSKIVKKVAEMDLIKQLITQFHDKLEEIQNEDTNENINKLKTSKPISSEDANKNCSQDEEIQHVDPVITSGEKIDTYYNIPQLPPYPNRYDETANSEQKEAPRHAEIGNLELNEDLSSKLHSEIENSKLNEISRKPAKYSFEIHKKIRSSELSEKLRDETKCSSEKHDQMSNIKLIEERKDKINHSCEKHTDINNSELNKEPIDETKYINKYTANSELSEKPRHETKNSLEIGNSELNEDRKDKTNQSFEKHKEIENEEPKDDTFLSKYEEIGNTVQNQEPRDGNKYHSEKYKEIGNCDYNEVLKNETKYYSEDSAQSENKELDVSKMKILPNLIYVGVRDFVPTEPLRAQDCYGPDHNTLFITCCHRLLEHWDLNKSARIILKFYFGIVALITMRSLAKTYKHVEKAFTKFQNYILYIRKSSDYNFVHFIPHKKFVGACHRKLKEKEKNTVTMFAKIITMSLTLDDQRPISFKPEHRSKDPFPLHNEEPFKMNFLKSTVLAHTSNYGLELIGIVQTMLNYISENGVNMAIEVSYCEETAESWKRLIEYINTNFSPDSKAKSHHWARLIDEEYYKDISCAENYSLAVILAVFEDRICINENIWLSKWIDKNDKENLERLKKLGLTMFVQLLRRDKRLKDKISVYNTITIRARTKSF